MMIALKKFGIDYKQNYLFIIMEFYYKMLSNSIISEIMNFLSFDAA
jgi:hypothetical protein